MDVPVGTWRFYDAGLLIASGEIDMQCGPDLRRAIAGTLHGCAIDVSGVTFIDTAGLDALVDPHGAKVVLLVNPSCAVVRLLDLLDQRACGTTLDRIVIAAS